MHNDIVNKENRSVITSYHDIVGLCCMSTLTHLTMSQTKNVIVVFTVTSTTKADYVAVVIRSGKGHIIISKHL